MSVHSSSETKLIDGDYSRELLRMGVANDRNMLSSSALVNTEFHSQVILAHLAFIEAGVDYISTINDMVTPAVGFDLKEIEELTLLAGTLAKKAQQLAVDHKRSVKVLGRLPPLMPSYRADRTLGRAKCDQLYSLIGKSLDVSVDGFLASAMSSLEEAMFAFDAASRFGKPIWIGLALNSAGDLRSGEPLLEALPTLVDHAIGHGARLRAILFSCSQPEDISKALQHVQKAPHLNRLLQCHQIQLGALGNQVSAASRAGELAEELLPGAVTTRSQVEKQIYAEFARQWIHLGVKFVGGCCGIGPRHLLMVRQLVVSDSDSNQPSETP